MKRKILLEILSLLVLIIPNTIYMICNLDVLKEANIIGITMLSLVVLSVIGLGALIHIKAKAGLWIMIIGAFMLVLSNVSYVGGIAFILEGVGLALDGYILKPLIINIKIKELEANGKSVVYTRNIE